jgi:hypothetical protein
VLRKAVRQVTVVCSITGTDQDPQNRSHVEKALRKAGAIVMPSNAAACKLAGRIVQALAPSTRERKALRRLRSQIVTLKAEKVATHRSRRRSAAA